MCDDRSLTWLPACRCWLRS